MTIINIITTENNIVSDIKSYVVVSQENENKVVEQVKNDFTEIVKNFSKPNELTDEQMNEYLDDGYSHKGIDIQIVWSYSYNE